MDAPQEPFYKKDTPDPMADVRDRMSRYGDFSPIPSDYANDTSFFEVVAVLEALEVEGEVLV